MDAHLVFDPLGPEHLAIVDAWARHPEVARWVDAPTADWLTWARTTPGYYTWIVRHGETPVGWAIAEIEADRSASVLLVVDPALQRRGYGRALLRGLRDLPALAGVSRFVAFVDPENVASVRCLTAAGFVLTGDRGPAGEAVFVFERERGLPGSS